MSTLRQSQGWSFSSRLQTRRDWTAAQIIAEYEQELARSKVQIDQVMKSNHGLNTALAAIREPTLRPTPKPQDAGQRASSTVTEGRASSPQPAPLSPPRASCVNPPIERVAGTDATTGSAPQMATSKVDADIVARINLLEQQLAHAQEDNKQLRQRVAEADRRLELEQQRNSQPAANRRQSKMRLGANCASINCRPTRKNLPSKTRASPTCASTFPRRRRTSRLTFWTILDGCPDCALRNDSAKYGVSIRPSWSISTVSVRVLSFGSEEVDHALCQEGSRHSP